MTAMPCPACPRTRAAGQYLCRTCWFQLTPAVRGLLRRRDALKVRRLQQLLDAVRAGTPLPDIRITEGAPRPRDAPSRSHSRPQAAPQHPNGPREPPGPERPSDGRTADPVPARPAPAQAHHTTKENRP